MASVVLLAVAMPLSVRAEPARVDITQTPSGRSIAAAAKQRFADYGPEFASESVRVIRLEDGSITVVPAAYGPDDIEAGGDGSVRIAAGGSSMATVAAAGDVSIAATPTWTQMSSNCFARTTIKTPNGNSGGFMDTCYRIYKLVGETSSTYDYWNITSWATADATRANTIGDYAWIHVDRDGGGTWAWEDWSPRGDITDNCGSRSLGISALGFGLSFGTTVCETWLLTKYAAPGELKVQWNGDSTGAREVALMSAIKVTPGASPIWGISWNSVLKCRPGFVC